MGVFEGVMAVLIKNDYGLPDWIPVGLLEFDFPSFPPHWEFVLIDGVDASGGAASLGWAARWGYPELVRNSQHSDSLVERDEDAVRVFLQEYEKRCQEDIA
ncbi:MAG: hypothetical protein WAO61_09300 [Solirubrobacterales bacterium]